MLCLTVTTDPGWAGNALRDEEALLIDHAHCEMKAASNALSLAGRHAINLELTRVLATIAREEIAHFQRVIALLAARALVLPPATVDAYAAELRRAASELAGDGGSTTALVDRLLVGALIEARSCKRFKLLADATAGKTSQADLHVLWTDLFVAEAQHYRAFVDLAMRAASDDRAANRTGPATTMNVNVNVNVAARLRQLAVMEGEIVSNLARRGTGSSRSTIHG
ncbi:MAG: tRNA-(ms[2]io[6]A)-hydroxylase [Myxococcota bacterium]|nr:tRNA-(ms[2]io[6]A)-hydroxylase [Myxococcota bacterium]